MTGAAVDVDLPTGPVEVRASTFAGGQAAALQATQRARAAQAPTITVRDNTFTGNAGGAITLVGIPPGVLHGDPLAQTQPVRLVTAYNRFRNNQAQAGGAVDADLTNTTGCESTGDLFLGNAASGSGGAILISGGSASITHALFADNRAAASGGAISVTDQSAVIVANTLAVRNAAATGVFAGDALTFVNATIAANAAVGLLGGPGARMTNTILAGNRPTDCSGLSTGAFVGPNIQSDSSCPGVPSGDAYLDPMFIPAPGSPVRTAGDLKACLAAPVSGSDILFQERGLGGFCALGAFEAVPVRSLGQAAAGPAPHGDPSDDFPDADASSADPERDPAARVLRPAAGRAA
jgi:predicted outer membrane repeat protein